MFPIIDIETSRNSQQVLSDLANTSKDIMRAVERESFIIATTFNSDITDYPAETDGNQPPTPYYSRGTGYIRGGGRIDPMSEQFGDSVHHKITSNPKEVTIRFKLVASYSKWLVGSRDQAWFHARNGWKTIRTVLKGLNIDADEFTNSTVPATGRMRQAVTGATSRLRRYS